MRKNRKMSSRMSVVARNTTRFAAILLMLFAMSILNFLANSRCEQQMKSIGLKEKELKRLDDERDRESARWEEMKTPERLETALKRHGLAMRYPKPSQIIRMNAAGNPVPGQHSVAKAKERNSRTVAMAGSRRSR